MSLDNKETRTPFVRPHEPFRYPTLPATPGIYTIRNRVTGRVYVGSSMNMKSRLYQHFWLMLRGKHHCKKMQSEAHLYGMDMLEVTSYPLVINRDGVIATKATNETLAKAEAYWISYWGLEYEKGFAYNKSTKIIRYQSTPGKRRKRVLIPGKLRNTNANI